MDTGPNPLLDLVSRATRWARTGDSFMVMLDHAPGGRKNFAPFSTLAAYDADLLSCMVWMQDHWRKTHQLPYIPGDAVRLTLRHWGRIPPSYERGGETYFLESVVFCSEHRDAPGFQANVQGYHATNIGAAATRAAASLWCVDRLVQHSVHLTLEWLDIHYPGWQQRYATAQALELRPQERLALLFEPRPEPGSISLTGLTLA